MFKRFALAAALSACFALYAHDTVREEFHHTYPLAAAGRVSVSNVNGSIHISTWDRNEVKVDAVKSADDDETLKEVQIVVDAQADSVAIRTKYPEGSNRHHSGAVAYTLTVPRAASIDKASSVNGGITIDGVAGRVEASSVNGNVEVSGASGNVHLSAVNGRVETRFDRLAAQQVSMSTVNGSVAITLPREAGAHLKASTVHGSIHSDFDIAVRDVNHGPGSHLDTQIGSGGAEIELRTVNGGIQLARR